MGKSLLLTELTGFFKKIVLKWYDDLLYPHLCFHNDFNLKCF